MTMRNLEYTPTKRNKKNKGISARGAEIGAPRDVPKQTASMRSVTSISLGVPCLESRHASTETGRVNAAVSSEGMIAWLPSGNTGQVLAGRLVSVFIGQHHRQAELCGWANPYRRQTNRTTGSSGLTSVVKKGLRLS